MNRYLVTCVFDGYAMSFPFEADDAWHAAEQYFDDPLHPEEDEIERFEVVKQDA